MLVYDLKASQDLDRRVPSMAMTIGAMTHLETKAILVPGAFDESVKNGQIDVVKTANALSGYSQPSGSTIVLGITGHAFQSPHRYAYGVTHGRVVLVSTDRITQNGSRQRMVATAIRELLRLQGFVESSWSQHSTAHPGCCTSEDCLMAYMPDEAAFGRFMNKLSRERIEGEGLLCDACHVRLPRK